MDQGIVQFAAAACAWTNVIQYIARLAAAACVCTYSSLGAPANFWSLHTRASVQGTADALLLKKRVTLAIHIGFL
jgi:hypothetical protein